ncbi:MAG: tRNA (adenosine(37)-N6)-threonylcarbamoyltransferase complex dimerization subunit type 1 TsaB [Metamycoplasmataceae bacterium]
MHLFIDTSQKNFAIALFNENFVVIKYEILEIKFKVESLIAFIDKNNIKLNHLKKIYINLGPGSFTGSRIALVYARTIAQINKCELYTTNSFLLATINNNNKTTISIEANKYRAYVLDLANINDLSKTTLVENQNKNQLINYEELFQNFNSYLSLFKREDYINKINVNYLSTPQIGEIK